MESFHSMWRGTQEEQEHTCIKHIVTEKVINLCAYVTVFCVFHCIKVNQRWREKMKIGTHKYERIFFIQNALLIRRYMTF